MSRRLAGAARVLAGLLTALLVASCGTPAAPDRPRPAPALRGADLDGRAWDLAELRGSVVLVSAWASWCAPCREEVPVLSRAQDRLADDGLVVLGLNVQDSPESARRFVDQLRPSFPSVADDEGTLAVDWGIVGLPETFLVDRDGTVVARRSGAVTDEWVADVVAPVVQP